jgi:hypothetical protein
MTEISTGKVRITLNGTTTYYLDPGCSVTRTVTRMFDSHPIPGAQNKLVNLGRTESDIIRIDATVSATDLNAGMGAFPPETFITALKAQKNSQTSPASIYWRSTTYTGLVKSVTVTDESGKGDMLHVGIVFEVGETL